MIKGTTVINTTTGERGTVRSVWLNRWSNQEVVNVRVNGMMASWNAANVTGIETEKAA